MIALDRVLTPSWIVRRVQLGGVIQNEHLTQSIGRGTASNRVGLKVMLRGRVAATVGGRQFELGPGDFLLLPRLADSLTSGGDHETLEIDGDADAPIVGHHVRTVQRGSLGETATTALHALADSARDGRLLARGSSTLPAAFRALAAEGLPFDAS